MHTKIARSRSRKSLRDETKTESLLIERTLTWFPRITMSMTSVELFV